MISSLTYEFIRHRHNNLDDGLLDECHDLESQISLWIHDILKIKPELAQLIDYNKIINMDFELLDFDSFGLGESSLEEKNLSDFYNFYYSSYYVFIKLKGEIN